MLPLLQCFLCTVDPQEKLTTVKLQRQGLHVGMQTRKAHGLKQKMSS